MTGGRIIPHKRLTNWRRDQAAERRRWRDARDGTQGPAGPCRRVDPVTGQVSVVERVTDDSGLEYGNITVGNRAVGGVPEQPGRYARGAESSRLADRI